MTDKGFLIDDICIAKGIKLIRPPFLSKQKQFKKEDALLNSKIAKARVHIERSNQRLKVFKILSTRLPSYLVNKIDQIFFIICAIVNLSSPIMKDDKFIVVQIIKINYYNCEKIKLYLSLFTLGCFSFKHTK